MDDTSTSEWTLSRKEWNLHLLIEPQSFITKKSCPSVHQTRSKCHRFVHISAWSHGSRNSWPSPLSIIIHPDSRAKPQNNVKFKYVAHSDVCAGRRCEKGREHSMYSADRRRLKEKPQNRLVSLKSQKDIRDYHGGRHRYSVQHFARGDRPAQRGVADDVLIRCCVYVCVS